MDKELLKKTKDILKWLAPFYAVMNPDRNLLYGCSMKNEDEGAVYYCKIIGDNICTEHLADSFEEMMEKLISEEEYKMLEQNSAGERAEIEIREFEERFEEKSFKADVLIQDDINQVFKSGWHPNVEPVYHEFRTTAEAMYTSEGLCSDKIDIHKLIKPKEEERYQRLFAKNEMLQVRLRKEKGNANRLRVSHMLVDVLEERIKSKELVEYHERIKREVKIHNDILGDFVLNRRLSIFEAIIEHKRKHFEMTFHWDKNYTDSDIAKMIKYLENMYKNIDLIEKNAVEFGVNQIIGTLNEHLKQLGKRKTTAKAYGKKLVLQSININIEGNYEIWFKEGAGNYGNNVTVYGSINGRFERADLFDD